MIPPRDEYRTYILIAWLPVTRTPSWLGALAARSVPLTPPLTGRALARRRRSPVARSRAAMSAGVSVRLTARRNDQAQPAGDAVLPKQRRCGKACLSAEIVHADRLPHRQRIRVAFRPD